MKGNIRVELSAGGPHMVLEVKLFLHLKIMVLPKWGLDLIDQFQKAMISGVFAKKIMDSFVLVKILGFFVYNHHLSA